nr:unnamed protein product [Spirometra erinaceieuropaei]
MRPESSLHNLRQGHDRLPQVEINIDLDFPPSLPQSIRDVEQLFSKKAPDSDSTSAEIYKHNGHRLKDRLTALMQEM